MMDEKFTPDVPEEEDNDGKLSLQQQFLSTRAHQHCKQLSHEV
jgi:hypothetical protein